ncbi:MAG: hypothetical protein M1839_009417 [Geoglossum umbratile]|nr:MAG: hypothetical protein M1839_009417 [Geoglossum umbratile]
MADLSDSDIIASNPIEDGLDAFCRLFKSTCTGLDISELQDASKQVALLIVAPGIDVKSLILDLIIALQGLPAARILPSKNASGVLLDDIVRFAPNVISKDFDDKSVVPLLEQVIKHASDWDIWNAVFALVTKPRATPPTVFDQSILGTPIKSTSSSQQGGEQFHSDIDPRILGEVNGCVYNDTKGFYEKYFEKKSWSSTAEQIVRDAKPQIIEGRWTDYPNPPSQDAFLEWLWRFQSTFLLSGRGTYYSSPSLPLSGSDCRRKPDLFLAAPGTTKNDGRYNWREVRVIGELKQSDISGKRLKEFRDFCGHAREVFTSQPTRLFLHGFVIRGSMVELWAFDRSGPYSCEKFDLNKDPDRFIKVIIGYTMMSDEELGLNTYIKEDIYGKYIMFRAEGKTKEEKLCLEEEPIAFQHAIVCRGTTCYRAKRVGTKSWEFVVKFSWRSDKRQAEGELLRLAKERGVWGVAQLFGYQDLDSIANLRQGLQFGKPRWFPSAAGTGNKKSGSKSAGLGIGGITLESSSSGQKRKRGGEATRRSKRSRSGNSRRRTDITSRVTAEQGGGAEDASKYGVEEAKTTSLMHPRGNDESFDNRIFCCLVVSPPGRAIQEFKSVLEFLEACRDVIKGHKSLYQEGKILHRDVSVNNLIIADAESGEDPRGILIDLDLAKELGSGPSGARHRTGTMEFMAIEVLKRKAHTYRHDLESFFYVFLWVIIRYGRKADKKLPETSRLRHWYAGSYEDIADMKQGHMSVFEDITAEFPPMFEDVKGLAEELRDILFGTGRLFTGTYKKPEDRDRMYDSMINAFERTIKAHQEMRKDAGSLAGTF